MRKFAIFLLFSPLLSTIGHAQDANPHQLKGEELRAVFTDTTILSEYQIFKGMHKKGYDFIEHHNADGTTHYTENGAPLEQGLWKIIGGDRICYQYPASPVPNQKHCFFIFQDGKCYYNFALQNMTPSGPKNWDHWWARFVRKGDGGQCGNSVG
ncbi:MAG: hypothetical protein COA43_10620 [Robiginitomaculum sp.]|nr:MAG: hypothetical protein COA43_10620 [Robiginitomaculum sp.]